MKTLEFNVMETFFAGGTYAKLCGAGLAATLFTGGFGALIWGPPTIGLCMAAWVEK